MSIDPEWVGGSPRAVVFHDALMPYVRNRGVWTCPSDPTAMDAELMLMGSGGTRETGCWGGTWGGSMGNLRYCSYNANYSVIRPGDNNVYFGGASYPLISIAILPRPADTVLLADGIRNCDFTHPLPIRRNHRDTAMASTVPIRTDMRSFSKPAGAWTANGSWTGAHTTAPTSSTVLFVTTVPW